MLAVFCCKIKYFFQTYMRSDNAGTVITNDFEVTVDLVTIVSPRSCFLTLSSSYSAPDITVRDKQEQDYFISGDKLRAEAQCKQCPHWPGLHHKGSEHSRQSQLVTMTHWPHTRRPIRDSRRWWQRQDWVTRLEHRSKVHPGNRVGDPPKQLRQGLEAQASN